MKTILVLCEISDGDQLLIDQAETMATAFGSRVCLIHVAAPNPDFVGYEVGPKHERDWRADTLREEHRQLQSAAEKLRNQNIDAFALLVQGSILSTLLKEAAELNADMIIVGNHHHGLFHRLTTNNISDGVTHKAHCPVLLVSI